MQTNLCEIFLFVFGHKLTHFSNRITKTTITQKERRFSTLMATFTIHLAYYYPIAEASEGHEGISLTH